MSRLIRSVLRPLAICTSQPQGNAQIDLSNPINEGLSSAFPSLATYPAYGEGILYHNVNSENTLRATRLGVGRSYARNGYNATTSGTSIGGMTEISGDYPQTVMLHGIRGAYDDTGAFLLDGNVDVYFSSSGQLAYDYGGGFGATTETVAVGGAYTVFMWAAGGNITAVDLNGDVVSTVGGLNWATGRAHTRIGCREGWGLINGQIISFHRWKRFLTAAERARLVANPWLMYQAPQKRLPVIDIVRGPALTRQSRLLGTSSGSIPTASTAGSRKIIVTQQPQWTAQIDWGNPITKGLVFAVNVNCNLPLELVRGIKPTFSGSSIVTTPEKFGVASQCVGGYLNYGRTGADDVTTQGTIVYVGRAETNPADVPVLTSDEGASGHGITLAIDNVTRVNNGASSFANNGAYVNTTGHNAVSSNLIHNVYIYTWDGTTWRWFTNGKQVNSGTSTFTCTANANRTTKLTNRFVVGTQNHRDALHLVYNRALTVGEAISISSSLFSPWQILKSNPKPIWVPT